MKTIFLDIDGVVHPSDAADVLVTEEGHLRFIGEALFVWNHILQELVIGKDVQIVIHSTWRHHYQLHELQNFFPESIRHQVVAVTEGSNRIDSIHRFLSQHQDIEVFGYVVLDDMLAAFQSNWPNLIACDGLMGISCSTVQKQIEQFIQSGS
jgi:hypothetical protein